jgi:2-dehydro-3-deoxygluconokinase
MAAVVGIGETLIRLTPGGGETLESAPTCTVHVGGAESNVCADLARLGVSTAWISRLPANPLGRRIASVIRGCGVDVEGVVWAPEGRVGVMFVQHGAAPRPGEVVYYRRDSAFAGIDPNAIAWDRLTGAEIVHLTGITPALGDGPHRLVERAIAEARRLGARISFDVNYRAKLWSPDVAREVIEPLIRGVDVVFVNDRDARTVFGAQGDPESVARGLRERFRCAVLVLTLGPSGALAHDHSTLLRQPAYTAEVVDRVGRGDAFAAGFLYGYLARGTGDGLRYGSALAALKQTYPGDICYATVNEVEAVLRGDAGGFHR